MKVLIAAICCIILSLPASGQKYFTRDGEISFYSEAPLEKIEAHNGKVSSVLDVETGDIEFAVLIKSFRFEKALMEEHFNENYLESNKYPKATFKGKITNLGEIDLAAAGEYTAQVKGQLTIHGVTQPLETTGKLKTGAGSIHATSVFDIAVADYKIEIPKVVRENIAKIVQVKVDIQYKPLEQ